MIVTQSIRAPTEVERKQEYRMNLARRTDYDHLVVEHRARRGIEFQVALARRPSTLTKGAGK